MNEEGWYYEKLDENGKVKRAPQNDADAKITGHHVFGLPYWFDENPEERKRLGWIKHITHKTDDIEYNKQTQYLLKSVNTIDPYTVEDEYHVRNKTAEMMRQEEMGLEVYFGDGIIWEEA